jgi:hypothetical protein
MKPQEVGRLRVSGHETVLDFRDLVGFCRVVYRVRSTISLARNEPILARASSTYRSQRWAQHLKYCHSIQEMYSARYQVFRFVVHSPNPPVR